MDRNDERVNQLMAYLGHTYKSNSKIAQSAGMKIKRTPKQYTPGVKAGDSTITKIPNAPVSRPVQPGETHFTKTPKPKATVSTRTPEERKKASVKSGPTNATWPRREPK